MQLVDKYFATLFTNVFLARSDCCIILQAGFLRHWYIFTTFSLWIESGTKRFIFIVFVIQPIKRPIHFMMHILNRLCLYLKCYKAVDTFFQLLGLNNHSSTFRWFAFPFTVSFPNISIYILFSFNIFINLLYHLPISCLTLRLICFSSSTATTSSSLMSRRPEISAKKSA